MNQSPELFRLLRLLALLGTAPLPNHRALAHDLQVDLPTLRRDGRILRAAGLAQLEPTGLSCSPEQLREACRMASEPCGPP